MQYPQQPNTPSLWLPVATQIQQPDPYQLYLVQSMQFIQQQIAEKHVLEERIYVLEEKRAKLERDLDVKGNILANTKAGIIVAVITTLWASIIAGAFTKHLEVVYTYIGYFHDFELRVAHNTVFYYAFVGYMSTVFGVQTTFRDFDVFIILLDILASIILPVGIMKFISD
jgi:hypothetical protein